MAAEWHWGEWGHTDPGGSLEAWTAGMARQAGADEVPGTLITLVDRVPVGLVCLVGQDTVGLLSVAVRRFSARCRRSRWSAWAGKPGFSIR
jgi:hypothetical protein